MMTYVLLIYASRPPGEQAPPADVKAVLVRHRALQDDARSRDALLSVAQLTDPGRARSVRARAGAHDVTDGPYLETKEWLVGFYLLECDDEKEAIERAKLLSDDGHSIEIRPVAWRWAR
jgi:hypothetical protein